MLMGTQWYLLFSIARAAAIPQDLKMTIGHAAVGPG